MSDVEVERDSNGRLDALIETALNINAFVDKVVRDTVNDVIAPIILPEAQAEPGPVARPIKWTSEKQRRYVMLMIKKGVIPAPYIRTHALSQGWAFTVNTVEQDYTQVTLSNSASKMTFVDGLNQQGFHSNTGWYSTADKFPVWRDIMVEKLGAGLQTAWGGI